MKFVSLLMLLLVCVSCASGGWGHPNNFWGSDASNGAIQTGQAAADHIHHHTPAPAPAMGF